MTKATLSISSRNYSSWSLRGWLLCRMAGLEFETKILSEEDPTARAELLRSSSVNSATVCFLAGVVIVFAVEPP